ncbi:hypothetical protein MRX96_036169 [Rhipicephalus microplus]
MAASDQRQTKVVQSSADENWVLLQDGGDAAKELLLEEQDGYASGEKKSLGNAAEGQESILDTAKFLGWCHSAWDDVHIHHALRDDIRPYAIGIALFVHTVLNLLAALAARVECEVSEVILTSFGHFAMVVLCPAAFSYVTRFVSLLAAQASAVKKVEVTVLLLCLLVTNAVILATGSFAWVIEVIAGFRVPRKVERPAGYLELPLFALQRPASLGAIWCCHILTLLMKADVVATFETLKRHWRGTEEARIIFAKRWLHPPKPVLLTAACTVVCLLAIREIFMIFIVLGANFGDGVDIVAHVRKPVDAYGVRTVAAE